MAWSACSEGMDTVGPLRRSTGAAGCSGTGYLRTRRKKTVLQIQYCFLLYNSRNLHTGTRGIDLHREPSNMAPTTTAGETAAAPRVRPCQPCRTINPQEHSTRRAREAAARDGETQHKRRHFVYVFSSTVCQTAHSFSAWRTSVRILPEVVSARQSRGRTGDGA